jgi:hypothetical protein
VNVQGPRNAVWHCLAMTAYWWSTSFLLVRHTRRKLLTVAVSGNRVGRVAEDGSVYRVIVCGREPWIMRLIAKVIASNGLAVACVRGLNIQPIRFQTQ